jgi:hypothetical protein
VAELADALDLGSSARKGVGVQVSPSAPYNSYTREAILEALKHCKTWTELAQHFGRRPDSGFTAKFLAELFPILDIDMSLVRSLKTAFTFQVLDRFFCGSLTCNINFQTL